MGLDQLWTLRLLTKIRQTSEPSFHLGLDLLAPVLSSACLAP